MNWLILGGLIFLGAVSLGVVNLSEIGKTYTAPEEVEQEPVQQEAENASFFNFPEITNQTQINTTDTNCSNFLTKMKFTIAQKAGLGLCQAETFTINLLSRWTDPFHFIFMVLIVVLFYGLVMKGSVGVQSMVERIFFLAAIIVIIIVVLGGI